MNWPDHSRMEHPYRVIKMVVQPRLAVVQPVTRIRSQGGTNPSLDGRTELIQHDDGMDNDGGDWSLVSSVDTAVAASADSAASSMVDVPVLLDTLSDDGRSNHNDGNEHGDSDNMPMEMVNNCDSDVKANRYAYGAVVNA